MVLFETPLEVLTIDRSISHVFRVGRMDSSTEIEAILTRRLSIRGKGKASVFFGKRIETK